MINRSIFEKVKSKLSRKVKKLKFLAGEEVFKIKDAPVVKEPDVLFVFCPPWDVYMPPLGISYLASTLGKLNFEVLIFDINIQLFNKLDECDKELWRAEKYNYWVDKGLFCALKSKFHEYIKVAADKIIETGAKIIGFSVHMSNRLFTIEVAKEIKKRSKDKLVVFGGYGCSNEQMRHEVPEGVVDIFVVGEGEETIVEIMTRINNRMRIENIEGAIIVSNSKSAGLNLRKPMEDLDSIPFPTYREYFLENYIDPTLPLLISRGCIGKCAFCNDYVLAHPYRARSAKNVFEEIIYHFNNNGVTSYSFKDLLCNGNIKNLEELCDLIIKEGLNLTWDSQAIPKRDMSLEVLLKLKKAGCHTLIYGVESFSDSILKKMRKYFTAEDAIEVLKLTKKAGIRTLINIIVGFPGEGEEDFMQTYNAIKENNDYIDMFSSLNTCCVNADCDLDTAHEDYGIILPDNPYERALKWHTPDGNTYQLRKERALKVLSLLDELGISYMCTNAKEENQSISWTKRDSLKTIAKGS
jgi:radical SAM superfamily enzyme YgiQ (UPF0313 family)